MWKCLVFTAVFLDFTLRGYANLGLLVNGRSANMTEFCAGEVLLFVCTIQTSIFQWNAGSLITGDTVSLGTDGAPGIEISGKFTLTAEGSGSNRRSTLQVTAFSDLSGVNIACRDPGNHDFVQTRTVTVYGVPSSPMVYVTLNGVTSLNLTISQPRESAECVQNYITTVTSIGLTGPLVSMVNASDSTPAFDTITNLSMCEYNYTVNVVAVDLAGNWSQPFVSMARITLEDIFVSKERNAMVQPNGDVSISFEIVISDCHESTLEFLYIDLTSMESSSKIRAIDESSLVNFTQRISGTQYMCVLNLVLPSMHRVEVDSFNCSTNESTVTNSPTVLTTSGPASSSLSVGAIIGIAVVAAAVAIVGVMIFTLGCWLYCKKAPKRKESNGGKGSVDESDSKRANDKVTHSSSRSVPEDQAPTYQAPETIQRQPAGPSGDLYTLVANKGNKGSKKAKKEEELPMYSVVDKNKKNDEKKAPETIQHQAAGPTGEPYTVASKGNKGSKKAKKVEELPIGNKNKKEEKLVYAGIDVQNPKASHSRHPPTPPGVTS